MRPHYPLTSAQFDIWLAQALNPQSPVYNIGGFLDIRGDLDPDLFMTALRHTVQQTDALHVRFSGGDADPRQFFADRTDELNLPLFDLSADDQPEATARAWMEDDLARTVDLAQGPLHGWALFNIAPGRFFFYQRNHHLLSDGYSLWLFAHRLAKTYSAMRQGLTLSFTEGSWLEALEAEQTYRQSAGFQLDRKYWHNRLRGLSAPATLSGRPPAPPGVRPRRTESQLDAATASALRVMAKNHGLSLSRFLAIATALYLHRYSSAPDVVIGLLVAARPETQREQHGMFSNILPLRLTLDGQQSFGDFLDQSAAALSEDLSHQHYRAEDMRRELGLSVLHGLVVNPMPFNYDLDFGGCTTAFDSLLSTGPEQDFSVNIYGCGQVEGRRLVFNAHPELYSEADLLGHARRFTAFLAGLAQLGTATPLHRISLLDPEERHQVLHGWNATTVPYSKNLGIHQLFQQQAARTPEAVALSFGNITLSYAELETRANQLAHHLRTLGIGPEIVVGICLPRSPALIIGLLAILKAGGAYLPLDPDYPADRLAFMLADSTAPLLITETACIGQFPEFKGRIVTLDTLIEYLATQPASPPEEPANPDQRLAYLIYTSGSTGKPKGVMITHAAVINFLGAMQSLLATGPDDSFLAVTSIAFDISVLEIFLPLCVGARCVLASRETARDGKALSAILNDSNITVAQMVPSGWTLLLESGWDGKPGLKILSGGEALSGDLAERLQSRSGELWNLFGPTETTVWSTAHRQIPGGPILIGRPIANTRIYILDPQGEPVPQGVAGELFIGGAGVARGYLNRPDLNAERFLPDPFAPEPDARMYKTGDLARWRPDGTIDFLGRNDFQVKLRGFRIELGEIEAALRACPGVREAVVLAREDVPGDKRLVAYFTGEPATVEDLRRQLKAALPDYMVPSAFVRLESLPLTPNGKINRAALPPPESHHSSVASQTHPNAQPLTATERVLINLWEALLRIEPITPDQDFFELGGHSLLAAELMSLIEKTFGRRLPLDTLWFKGSTVKSLARILDTEGHSAWPRVIDLKTGSGKSPVLFCAPLDSGNLFEYYALAKHLNPGQTVKGLQVKELTTGQAPRYSVQDIANDCIEAMRSSQPQGPYHLAGFSAGGNIAYEMARQLRAEGQEVALLSLFDTYPGPFTPNLNVYRRNFQKIRQLMPLDRRSPAEPGEFLKQLYWLTRQTALYFHTNWRWYSQWCWWQIIHHLGLNHWLAPKDLAAAHRYAICTYRPEISDASLTLYYVKSGHPENPTTAELWQSRNLARITAIEVPGDHLSITKEPEVIPLAKALQTLIDNLNQTDNP